MLPRPLINFYCVCVCACVCRPRPDEPECLKVTVSETSVRLGEVLAGNISESEAITFAPIHAKCLQLSDNEAFLKGIPGKTAIFSSP